MYRQIKAVYKITNTINNNLYIGQSTQVLDRFAWHKSRLNKNIHHNRKIQEDWNKYGGESFLFEIIKTYDTKNELMLYETYWKNYYSNLYGEDHIYNLGSTGYARDTSDETKILISKNNSMHQIENREKVRLSKLGTKLSEEAKDKIRKKRLGSKSSEETKKKISESLKKSFLMRLTKEERLAFEARKNKKKKQPRIYLCVETAEIGTSSYFANKFGDKKYQHKIIAAAHHHNGQQTANGFHFIEQERQEEE